MNLIQGDDVMAYCQNCGREIGDNKRFCPYCGAEQQHMTPPGGGRSAGRGNNYGGQNYDDSRYNGGSAGNSRNGGRRYDRGGYNGGNADYDSGQNYDGYDSYNPPQRRGGNDYEYRRPFYGGGSRGTRRNIALCILFSIITFGIYGLYWMVKMNDEINDLAGEPNATSGGLVILFEIITCNIYGWYWCYKMGERCSRIKQMMGRSGGSAAIYLILALFGLNIISYALMQDTINQAVDYGY